MLWSQFRFPHIRMKGISAIMSLTHTLTLDFGAAAAFAEVAAAFELIEEPCPLHDMKHSQLVHFVKS